VALNSMPVIPAPAPHGTQFLGGEPECPTIDIEKAKVMTRSVSGAFSRRPEASPWC
jgi:hypothetical protein